MPNYPVNISNFFVNWSILSKGFFKDKWIPQETKLFVFNEAEIRSHKLADADLDVQSNITYRYEPELAFSGPRTVREYIAREICSFIFRLAENNCFKIDNIMEV